MSPHACPTCGRNLDPADPSAVCPACKSNTLTPPPPATSLGALLGRWEDEFAGGRDVPAAELCRDCPERAAEVEHLIEALRGMKAFLSTDRLDSRKPGEEAGHAAPGGSFVTLPPGAPPAPAPPVAVTVPGYEVLDELGRGAMGVVYRARQVKLNRGVALKMVLSGGHASADELARFRTEAQALAGLSHPNILQVYEVGEKDGLPYFSMEFCPGGGLDKRLAGKPLPPREAAALVRTLALAVQAAHEKGIVHRDLKPANVLLAADGTPKVTDFGLAKRLGEQGRTASGAVLGTPSYMAPEQAQGKKDVAPAADVYALGAILYECLTGRPPFLAATPLDTILQVISDEPAPPRSLQPALPRDLETVCLKCLQKEPGRRYASAADLAEDLRRYLAGEPIVARPVGTLGRLAKWARRRPAVAALLAAVLLALAGGTGISTYFAVDAQHQAKEAKDAREEAEAALVDGLLRPVGREGGGRLSAVEKDALGRLASLGNERLRLRFLKTALERPELARQLSRRAERAVHAAVGLNADTRGRALELVRARLADPGADVRVRMAAVHAGLALRETDPAFTSRAAQTVIEATTSAKVPAWEPLRALELLAPRLTPEEAAKMALALLGWVEKTEVEMKKTGFQLGGAQIGVQLGGGIQVGGGVQLGGVAGTGIPVQQLVRLAPRLEDVKASRAVARLLADTGVPNSVGFASFVSFDANDLARAFEQLASRLDVEGSKAVAGTLLRLLAMSPPNPEHSTALLRAFDAVARRLGGNDLASLALVPLELYPHVNAYDRQLRRLSAAIDPLERRLDVRGAAAAVELLVRKSTTTTNQNSLAALVYVVARLLPRIDTRQARTVAAALAARCLKLGTATEYRHTVATLARAHAQLAPWLHGKEARDGAAALAKSILTVAAATTDPSDYKEAASAFSPLAESFDLLAPRLGATEAAKLAQLALRLSSEAVDARSFEVLTSAFVRLAPQLDAAEARAGAAALARNALARAARRQALDDFNAMQATLARVAGLLGPQEATEVARVLQERIEGGGDNRFLALLANGLGHLAPRLNAEQARVLAAVLARRIVRLPDEAVNLDDLSTSARALGRLAPRLGPSEASAAAAALGRMLTEFRLVITEVDLGVLVGSGEGDHKTENASLAEVATAFERLAPQLTPKAAGKASRAVLQMLARAGASANVLPLQRGFKHLEARLDAREAAATARASLALIAEARDDGAADALAQIFERLDRGKAATRLRAALDGAANPKHPAALFAVAGTLKRLAPHLSSQQVREAALAVMRAALRQIARNKSPAALLATAGTLHRLAPHLSSQQVHEGASTIERRIVELSSSRIVSDLVWLTRAYERIVPHRDTRQASATAASLAFGILGMRTTDPETGQPLNPLDSDATEEGVDPEALQKEFKGLLGRLTDQAVIDVLKSAACMGAYRDAVLVELGRRTKRRFTDLWDFVAWARDNRPDLDLLTPPQPPES
jgi:tRNA A-37 threonylcarbamoyl transferase component Bud32